MPNRIIKESICTNEQIDALTPFDETFFYRLIVNADDYGRMDGRPSILRARLYPLKTIRDDQIEKALANLATVELVRRYTVHGKPFVSLSGWERNQSIRAKKSKYPSPEDADDCVPSKASEITCMQMHADESGCPRNPIQSESKSNPNPEAERAQAATATLEAYAAANLSYLSPKNMDELVSFREDLPDDVIRHAIDEACANGVRSWAYVRSILNRYVQAGIRSLGDIRQQDQRRAVQPSAAVQNQALNYAQRLHTDADYQSIFVNLEGDST